MGNFLRDFGAAGNRIMDFANTMSNMSIAQQRADQQQQLFDYQRKKLDEQEKKDNMLLPSEVLEQQVSAVHSPEAYKALEQVMLNSGHMKDVNGKKFIRAGDLKQVREYMKTDTDALKSVLEASTIGEYNKMTQNLLKANKEQDPIKRGEYLKAAQAAQENYVAAQSMSPKILEAATIAREQARAAQQYLKPTPDMMNAAAMGVPLDEFYKKKHGEGGEYGKGWITTTTGPELDQMLGKPTGYEPGQPVMFHPGTKTIMPYNSEYRDTGFVGPNEEPILRQSRPGSTLQKKDPFATGQGQSGMPLTTVPVPEGSRPKAGIQNVSATERTEAAQFNNIKMTVDRINRMMDDPATSKKLMGFTGKFDASKNQLGNLAGFDNQNLVQFSELVAELNKLYNIVYGESGKQINDTELKRLQARIPDAWDNAAAFKGKLTAFTRQLNDSINTRKAALKASGVRGADQLFNLEDVPKINMGERGDTQSKNPAKMDASTLRQLFLKGGY